MSKRCTTLFNCEKNIGAFRGIYKQNELNNRKIIEEKLIKTLIYGVKSSGNQSERGLCETARMSAVEFPEVNHIVQKDIYLDDCLSSA